MNLELAEDLERFIERDGLWEVAALDRCCALFAGGSDGSPEAALLHTFAALRLLVMELGPVPERLQRDVEGVVYPRLWKVIEAVRDDLPAGEQLSRARALNHRLAHLFAAGDE